MNGKFFGIGVGPGDPELITVKAVKILNSADIIIAPETMKDKGSVAYEIIQSHLENKEKIRFQTFPMTYDHEELDESWKRNMEEILGYLKAGNQVAFITLGDPMIYSTYIYVMRLIKEQGIEVETIPGIPSFCAAASRIGIPISEGNETIAIIPAAYKCADLEEIMQSFDNTILMKPSRGFKNILSAMGKNGLEENGVLVSKCGHHNEKVVYDVKHLEEGEVDYLSIMLVKKGGLR